MRRFFCFSLAPSSSSLSLSSPSQRSALSLSLPLARSQAATRKRRARAPRPLRRTLAGARQRGNVARPRARVRKREREEREEEERGESPDTLGFFLLVSPRPRRLLRSMRRRRRKRTLGPAYLSWGRSHSRARPPQARRGGARGRLRDNGGEGRRRRLGAVVFCARAGGQLQRGALSRLLLKVAEETQLGLVCLLGVRARVKVRGKKGEEWLIVIGRPWRSSCFENWQHAVRRRSRPLDDDDDAPRAAPARVISSSCR